MIHSILYEQFSKKHIEFKLIKNKSDYDKLYNLLNFDEKLLPFNRGSEYKYYIILHNNDPIGMTSLKMIKVDDAGHKFGNIRVATNVDLRELNLILLSVEFLKKEYKISIMMTTMPKTAKKLKLDYIRFGKFVYDEDEDYNSKRLNYLNKNKIMLIHY